MERNEFDQLKRAAEGYRFTSMAYVEYEAVPDYRLACRTKELLAVVGWNPEAEMTECHWAANDAKTLLAFCGTQKAPVMVTFIPPEWKADFLSGGFCEYGVLRDYWRPSLEDVPEDTGWELLSAGECAAASAVTLACRWQSREFHGETAEWIAQWQKGMDPNAAACGTRDAAVLCCHADGVLTGIACVGVYGDGSDQGPVLWVRELAVDPAFQGKGYGKRLLFSALAYGKAHGAARSFLMADDCNERGVALYRKAGYLPKADDAQIDLFYPGKEDAE